MLDYLSYGAIGIAMATAILAFRLLSSEQKKEQPNESILKMIKLFMGLAIFFSLFFGVVELMRGGSATEELTVERAANFLSEADSSKFLLNTKPGSQTAAVYLNYGSDKSIELGKLTGNSQVNLNGMKGTEEGVWEIAFGSTRLGRLKVGMDEYRLMADSTSEKSFVVGTWYRVDESDFWFKINQISGRSPNYEYNVVYGEGRNVASILPSDRSLDYSKTSDGFIFLNQPFKWVRNDQWKRQYCVKFGAGLALAGSQSVEKLNVQVIGVTVD